MKKSACLGLAVLLVLSWGQSHAQDRTIRKISIDSSNTLLIRLQSRLIPGATVIPPPPTKAQSQDIVLAKDQTQTITLATQGPQPPPLGFVYAGLGGGNLPDSLPDVQQETYKIVLRKDKIETLLDSLTSKRFAVPDGTGYGRFRFCDFTTTSESFYYTYLFKNELFVVKLRKEGEAFQKVNEIPFAYDINMREPLIYESLTHQVILILGKKAYQETSKNEFVEIGFPDRQEIEKAAEAKQERERAERKNTSIGEDR